MPAVVFSTARPSLLEGAAPIGRPEREQGGGGQPRRRRGAPCGPRAAQPRATAALRQGPEQPAVGGIAGGWPQHEGAPEPILAVRKLSRRSFDDGAAGIAPELLGLPRCVQSAACQSGQRRCISAAAQRGTRDAAADRVEWVRQVGAAAVDEPNTVCVDLGDIGSDTERLRK